MQRHLVAVIAVALLVATAVLFFTNDGEQASRTFAAGVCMRAGLVCAALWLAFPQVLPLLTRRPSPFTIALILGVLMVVINPRYAIIAAIMVAAIGVLQAIKWLFTPFSPQNQTASKSKGKRS